MTIKAMKKPIAKLREDVVKAAMRLYHSNRVHTSHEQWQEFDRAETAFNKACAVLEKRTKK